MAVSINNPSEGQQLPLSSTIRFDGTVDDDLSSVIISSPFSGEVFELGKATVSSGRWNFNFKFNTGGERTIVADQFDASGKVVGTVSVHITLFSSDLGKLVDVPKPDQINKNLTSPKNALLFALFGQPGNLTDTCSAITNPTFRKLLKTRNVGPFRVTGLEPAVEALARIFANVNSAHPNVFAQVKTAGMLCCRKVRNTQRPVFSNHSWGTAIDLQFGGALDNVGDGKTQEGLLLLAPFFEAEKFFWGAEFKGSREDSMHFECSAELLQQWRSGGII